MTYWLASKRRNERSVEEPMRPTWGNDRSKLLQTYNCDVLECMKFFCEYLQDVTFLLVSGTQVYEHPTNNVRTWFWYMSPKSDWCALYLCKKCSTYYINIVMPVHNIHCLTLTCKAKCHMTTLRQIGSLTKVVFSATWVPDRLWTMEGTWVWIFSAKWKPYEGCVFGYLGTQRTMDDGPLGLNF